MYWTLTTTELEENLEHRGLRPAGRFVLQRHTDAMGEHLDLRIESEDALHGWRIDASALDDEVWATEKRPHSKRWLAESNEAEAIDAGCYAVETESAGEVVLILEGRSGLRRVGARRFADVPASTLGSIVSVLETAGARIVDAAKLIEDGVAARTRAIARLCGLGRELDGTAFEESIWKKALQGLSIEEIHAQLRAFEVRFDQRYPAAPVSRPERIEEDEERDARALKILRG